MHGNGNDFIVLENLTKTNLLSKSQIIKMGDRKKGLGFDQLITINSPINSEHDFYIKYSVAHQCLQQTVVCLLICIYIYIYM